MKRSLLIFAVCLAILATLLSGCATKLSLYKKGLEITAIMEEMLDCQAFSKLYQTTDFSDILAAVDTNDYQSPKAIYSITAPSAEDMLALLGMGTEWWDGLSDTMKEQIDNRVSVQSIISTINGRAGTDKIAFSSVYFASKNYDAIDIQEEIVYLYTFEQGTPIAVIFDPNGTVSGYFVFADELNTLADVQGLFAQSDCTVEEVAMV